MKETVLFIDAGHGGYDPKTKKSGTFVTDGKMTKHTNGHEYHDGPIFYEGASNRAFAMQFMEEALSLGFLCVPVFHAFEDSWRSYNYSKPGTPWQEGSRCDIANSVWEKMDKPKALCLSFHSNAVGVGTGPQNSAEGVCAFVYKLGTNTAKLAAEIMKPVEQICTEYGSGKRAQLVHDDKLDMTSHTNMPAILFEMLFFDNPRNADLLINKEFRTLVVKSMAGTINRLLP